MCVCGVVKCVLRVRCGFLCGFWFSVCDVFDVFLCVVCGVVCVI